MPNIWQVLHLKMYLDGFNYENTLWRKKQYFFTYLILLSSYQLIQKSLKIGGQVVPIISLLEINFSYLFKSYNKIIKIEEGELPFPDEFWTKEQKDELNMNYALQNKILTNKID